MFKLTLVLIAVICLNANAKGDNPEYLDIELLKKNIATHHNDIEAFSGGKTETVKNDGGKTVTITYSNREQIIFGFNSSNQVISSSHIFQSKSTKCSKENIIKVYDYPKHFIKNFEKKDNIIIWSANQTVIKKGDALKLGVHVACDEKEPNAYIVSIFWINKIATKVKTI